MSIHKNEKTLISTDEYPLAGFTNMTQKLLSYPVFKVMWTDSGSIKREAGWIIQCSFLKRDKRRGESDNLSAGDKLGEWIRDEEKKKSVPADAGNPVPSTISATSFYMCLSVYPSSFYIPFVVLRI